MMHGTHNVTLVGSKIADFTVLQPTRPNMFNSTQRASLAFGKTEVIRLAKCCLKGKLAEQIYRGLVANMPLATRTKKGGNTEWEKKGGKV